MKKISAISEKKNLRTCHPNYPNNAGKVACPLGLAAFAIGPALLLALATEGALLPLVWILANDAIGVALGVLFYRRSAIHLPKIADIPSVDPASKHYAMKRAA